MNLRAFQSTCLKFTCCVAFVLAFAASLLAQTTNYVTNTSDSGPGSLRQSMSDLIPKGGGTILFSSVSGTISLSSTLPTVRNLTVVGPGTNQLSIASTVPYLLSFPVMTTNYISGLTFINGGISNAGVLTIENCLFTRNPGASTFARALENNGTLTLLSSTIANHYGGSTNNPPEGGFGAGLITYGTANIQDCFFYSNNAARGSYYFSPSNYNGATANGGAIYVGNGFLYVTRSIFMDNCAPGEPASSDGSGQYAGSGGAGRGGAIAVGNAVVIFLAECTFARNTASGGSGSSSYYYGGDGAQALGGAIFVTNASVGLYNCTFYSNRVTGGNGGSCSRYGYRYGNPGSVYGGALSGGFTLTNCTIYGNVCQAGLSGSTTYYPYPGSGQAQGGAIYGLGSLRLVNCTLANNKAVITASPWSSDPSCGGVFINTNGFIRLINTIVASNVYQYSGSSTNPSDGYGAFISRGYNLIGNTANMTGLLSSDLTNVEPRLGPLQDNGGSTWTCALLAGSPAIDAGTNSPVPFDQRGKPRVRDYPAIPNAEDGTDIGAFESNPPPDFFDLHVTGSDILVRFATLSDEYYVIQSSPDLKTWHNASSVIPGNGGLLTYTDVGGATTTNRFYRSFQTQVIINTPR